MPMTQQHVSKFAEMASSLESKLAMTERLINLAAKTHVLAQELAGDATEGMKTRRLIASRFAGMEELCLLMNVMTELLLIDRDV